MRKEEKRRDPSQTFKGLGSFAHLLKFVGERKGIAKVVNGLCCAASKGGGKKIFLGESVTEGKMDGGFRHALWCARIKQQSQEGNPSTRRRKKQFMCEPMGSAKKTSRRRRELPLRL